MNKYTIIGIFAITVGTLLMTQLIKDQRLIIVGGVINAFGIFLMTKGSSISSNKDKSEIIEKFQGFREEISVMKSGITDRESLNKIEIIENEFNEWAGNFVSDFESKKVDQQKSEILLREKEIKLSKKWRHIYLYTFEVIQQMLTAYNQRAKNKIEFILPALPHNLFDKDAESFKSLIIFDDNTVWRITLQIKRPYKKDEIPNIHINCFFGDDKARKHAEEISFPGDGLLLLIIDLETECLSVHVHFSNVYIGEVKDEYSISTDSYKTSIKDLFTTLIEHQIIRCH